jgi:iron complex outermembrane receptor protein
VKIGQSIIQNVPLFTTQGAELNVFGSPFDGLNVQGGVAYTNAFYGPGMIVSCGPGQTAAQGCDLATGTTDAEGRPAINTPLWKLSLSGDYEWSLAPGWLGTVAANATYTSPVQSLVAPDPLGRIGSGFILGARIGVRFDDERYGISIFGRNLTDAHVPGARLPVFLNGGDTLAHFQFFTPDANRVIGLSLDAKF